MPRWNKVIWLGGKHWHVIRRALGEDRGRCDFGRREIVVDEDLDAEEAKSTLIHELLHVVEDHMGLDVPESTTLAIERGWHEVLASNKWVARLYAGK